jgi:hypothetical protein
MKKAALLSLTLCCLLSTHTYAAEDGTPKVLLSANAGAIIPIGDLHDFGTGSNITISVSAPIKKYYGFGGDINFNNTEGNKIFDDRYHSSKIDSISIEALFYIQPNEFDIQPYLAVGVGSYYSNVKETQNIGGASNTVINSFDSGYGFVGKVGLRKFIMEKLFVGIFGKIFSNVWTFKISGNSMAGNTLNMGGYVICGELGWRF